MAAKALLGIEQRQQNADSIIRKLLFNSVITNPGMAFLNSQKSLLFLAIRLIVRISGRNSRGTDLPQLQARILREAL